MSRPIVAIVGRPNVGKSTLFNRLVGFRKAIVDPLAGLTRDRLYGVAEWRGRELTVVDTAGLGPAEDATVAQTRIANALIGLLHAIPTTPLFDRLKSEGRLNDDAPGMTAVASNLSHWSSSEQ